MRHGPVVLSLLLLASPTPGQMPAIDPAGVAGARIVAGGGRLPAAVYERFVELAGGDDARIVLIPTATARADDSAWREQHAARWQRDHPGVEFTVLHTRSRDEADDPAFAARLGDATGVWFGGGQQRRLAEVYVGTATERAIQALLRRGGVVGGSSAGAAIQSRVMIQSGNPEPVLATGLDLVPGAVVDQHFAQRDRLPRLRAALAPHPGRFGLGIDERTAVELRGRRLRVLGEGAATLLLAAGAGRSERLDRLTRGGVADLVSWQRAARDRAGTPWPPPTMAAPRVASGALVIVGGGRLGEEIVDRFVALAGGADAVIAVVPTASGREPRDTGAIGRALQARGVAEVRLFHWRHPEQQSDEQLARLDGVTGLWFGGGRQWRLCDAYEGTPALTAFRAVLERGGVIGGSSAGATIQGDFLVRGNPLGNRDEWSEGYDRGFGYLPGCAIDQHFLARDRTADLRGLIAQLPQLVGLGIDEATAAVVQGGVLEVVGASKVGVFDVRTADAEAQAAPEPVWLEPGERWDLVGGERAR